MPVYVDGRERPPAEANHTWGGFSVGTWEGDMLKIKTTHIKEDYIRRNGAMASDQTTVTTYWIRRGDILTWVNIIRDPIYLAEPLIRSSEYRLTVNSQVPAHPCTAAFEGLEKGAVPHYLPNENPFLKDIRNRYGLAVNQPTAGPGDDVSRVSEDASAKRVDGRRQARPSTAVPRGEGPVTSRYATWVAAAVAVGLVRRRRRPRQPVHAQGAAAGGEIRVLPLRGNVYVLTGAGAQHHGVRGQGRRDAGEHRRAEHVGQGAGRRQGAVAPGHRLADHRAQAASA